jgi:hypothetical protein
MEETNEILNNLNSIQVGAFEFNFFPLLKVPAILLLIGNLLFSLILYLRVRMLSDTFVMGDNKVMKSVIVLYLIATFLLTLVAMLFLILS